MEEDLLAHDERPVGGELASVGAAFASATARRDAGILVAFHLQVKCQDGMGWRQG